MVFEPHAQIRIVTTQYSSVLGEETIVLNYDIGQYYELNELGGFVWSLLQKHQTLTVETIKEEILNEFDVEESVCQEELVLFLDMLLHEKLIETAG